MLETEALERVVTPGLRAVGRAAVWLRSRRQGKMHLCVLCFLVILPVRMVSL